MAPARPATHRRPRGTLLNDSESNSENYAQTVVDHMVRARAKGASLSGTDEQYIFELEEVLHVPLHAVLKGIDDAFQRRTDPPRSLRQCKKWIMSAFRLYKREADAPPEDTSVVFEEPTEPDVAPNAALTPIFAHLELAASSPDQAVRAAMTLVVRDATGVARNGSLAVEVVELLDETFVTYWKQHAADPEPYVASAQRKALHHFAGKPTQRAREQFVARCIMASLHAEGHLAVPSLDPRRSRQSAQ